MNPLTHKTGEIILLAGVYNPNVDAGIYIGIPLPAKELKATLAIIKNSNMCEVNWYTKDEMNTKEFFVERSTDGVSFEKVGALNALGNSQGRTDYNILDNIENVRDAQVIYYRIKLMDIDNKYYYSNTISVKPLSLNDETILIFPTPFDDKLTIEYLSVDASDLQIEITDIFGKTIMQKVESVNIGLNQIRINNLSSFASGQYFIKIKDLQTGEMFIRKIVK
jgi:hypothetical protein